MKAVVLLSGGLDSSTALAQAVRQGNDCVALTFLYGQNHAARESEAAGRIAAHYGVPQRVVELPDLFGGSALTGTGDLPERPAESPDASVVPGRNLMMVAAGAAYADGIGAGAVVFAANKDDEAGYADCRKDFVLPLRDAVQAGTAHRVWLHTPFLHSTKAEVVQSAMLLGMPIALTWSCYRGGAEPCGRCGACLVRAAAGA